ncbi:hypothetical protein H9P43_006104 [Blastocladiella emersonii ATCC 22665]|nr:hypothetical protein H9P43_006104 [Blastocladiella emersonii ATCC 22665]
MKQKAKSKQKSAHGRGKAPGKAPVAVPPRTYLRLDALLFQCGDLRDVAHTIDEAKRKSGYGADQTFPIGKDKLTRYVGQPVYSSMLEPATHQFWLNEMRSCLNVVWAHEDARARVLDEDTMRAVRHCWESWLACDWSRKKTALPGARRAYSARLGNDGDAVAGVEATIDRFMAKARKVYGSVLPTGTANVELKRSVRSLADEIFLFDAATNQRATARADLDLDLDLVVNPTMLPACANRSLGFVLGPAELFAA